jgi:transposase
MIEEDRRKAIFLLHQEGMPLREIARRLQVARATVATIIRQAGALPKIKRSDKRELDEEVLRDLYALCDLGPALRGGAGRAGG